MWRPRLRDTEAPIQLGLLMSPTAAETVKGLMRETVLHGTGRPANIKGLNVCGKTGTAEAPSGDDHAWFTCFAPAAKPEIVVTVIVENGGYGSKAAAPIARAVLEEAVDLGLVGTDAREDAPAQ
jgi:cell division protein FtsI/penicillin-binding protein 2